MNFRAGPEDTDLEGESPRAVRANAELMRRVLGKMFPPEFSLSPAETM